MTISDCVLKVFFALSSNHCKVKTDLKGRTEFFLIRIKALEKKTSLNLFIYLSENYSFIHHMSWQDPQPEFLKYILFLIFPPG